MADYKSKSKNYSNSYNRSSKNNSKYNDKNSEEKPARAPYNFIGFPREVFMRYEKEDSLPKFDKFHKDLNTGYVDFSFKNETELFVGGEKKVSSDYVNFFTNIDGKICIPGSSIRGIIRKNCEILGLCYPEFIEDKVLMYRKFASKATKLNNEYKEVISLKKGQNISDIVRAGYIYKDKNEYKLVPAKEINKKSFFLIDERKMRNFNLPENKINFMYNDRIKGFKPNGNNSFQRNKDWDNFLRRNTNRNYSAYTTEISFLVDNENKIMDMSIKNELINKGILCNSNYINNKKKHYIVNEIDTNKDEYVIEDKLVISYKDDCEIYGNQRKNKEYYELPAKDGIENAKVFFYKLENSNVKYFGRSPYLRVFYKKSIRDCVKTKFISGGIDYTNAMFGYTKNNNKKSKDTPLSKVVKNYKSRISFMDVICNKPKMYSETHHLVLASPKPTSPQLYLNQHEKYIKTVNTLNDSDARLRGYKFYWNKNGSIKDIEKNEKSKLTTNIKNILKPENVFVGRVYFENLTDDELGLLLLGINFNNNCKESIGMGKPYGFGRVKIEDVKLYLEDIENKFLNFNNNYNEVKDIQKYKDIFINFISENAKIDYMKEKSIREYIRSKESIKDKDDVSYMKIKNEKGENEYNKLGVLPETLQIK